MKASCTLMASVLAASTAALTSADNNMGFCHSSNEGQIRYSRGTNCAGTSASEKEKFAPRFDGLKFIETLVTAHR